MMNQTPSESSILILPDGRLLVRNLTPTMAAALLVIQPQNAHLAPRAGKPSSSTTTQTSGPATP